MIATTLPEKRVAEIRNDENVVLAHIVWSEDGLTLDGYVNDILVVSVGEFCHRDNYECMLEAATALSEMLAEMVSQNSTKLVN